MSFRFVLSIPTCFAPRRTFTTSTLLRSDSHNVDPKTPQRTSKKAADAFKAEAYFPSSPFYLLIFLLIVLGQTVAEAGSGKAEETKKEKGVDSPRPSK
jgi:hypothetical protein